MAGDLVVSPVNVVVEHGKQVTKIVNEDKGYLTSPVTSKKTEGRRS